MPVKMQWEILVTGTSTYNTWKVEATAQLPEPLFNSYTGQQQFYTVQIKSTGRNKPTIKKWHAVSKFTPAFPDTGIGSTWDQPYYWDRNVVEATAPQMLLMINNINRIIKHWEW